MRPAYLYHYSDQLYQTIKTKRAQGKLTKKEIEEGKQEQIDRSQFAPWYDCISLFFDPIPAKLLPEIYKDHKSWKEGTTLVEHVIDARQLERDILFSVTESERQTKFMDQWFKERNETDFANDEEMKEYYAHKSKLMQNYGEQGRRIENLLVQVFVFQGQTESYFRKVKDRPDFEDVKNLYAAYVPHIEIAPQHGIIKPIEFRRVVMGSDNRDVIKP